MSEQKHWKKVYKTKSSDSVSGFQELAARLLEIVRSLGAKLSCCAG